MLSVKYQIISQKHLPCMFFFFRQLHCQVGEPHHVLCGQCVCCGTVTAGPGCFLLTSSFMKLHFKWHRDQSRSHEDPLLRPLVEVDVQVAYFSS